MCDVETQIGELEKHEGVSLEKETVNSLDREREEREWIEFERIEDDINHIDNLKTNIQRTKHLSSFFIEIINNLS